MKLLRIVIIATGVVLGIRETIARRDPAVSTAAGEPDRGRGTTTWRWLLPIVAFLVMVGFVGALALVSGIVPIKASSGHWSITAWLLDFAKRRSVATHTIGLEVPPLGEDWKVLKGAGHYENACRPCHGSPELQDPRIARQMTPRPPYLPPRISTWDPAALFSMVKHGIKFTGMPGWPAQHRDDEVWAMVAFLVVFPALGEEEYRRLVFGNVPAAMDVPPLRDLIAPPPAPRPVAESCRRCHGMDGRGREVGAFPRLTGQSPTYIELALRAFARGERHSGIMEPIAAALSDETMREIAGYYGSATPLPPRDASSSSVVTGRGADIATRGIPLQQVPACVECHGPAAEPKNPAYPRLTGQYFEYLLLQLGLFAEDRRGGSPYAHIMKNVASRLSREQMEDVARYFASLPGAVGQPSLADSLLLP